MTIYSGIFNSVRDSQGNGDKKYDAWWFAKYFSTFIGNGVFPNPSTNLQVIEGTNMQVIVRPGLGWIDGYFLYSDTNHVLDIHLADGVLKRIDRIVMRLDHQERMIDIVVKKGAFASNPVAPVLQRDGNAYELALADVFVANGATQITQANITDTRLNKTLCGIVHGTVDQVDTTTLFNQYQSWINQQKALYTQELEVWTADQRLSFEQWMAAQHSDFANWRQLEEQEFMNWMLMQQASFNDWMMQEQTDFEAWVATLEDLLDENIAATLTAKIVTLEQNFEAHENELASTSKTGHVQLNDTVTSASTTQAATANAVKQVNDALTQVNADLIQVDDTLTTHTDDFTSHVKFGVTSEADAKTITLTPAPMSLSMGFAVAFANTVANTGAVTLNVNNLGAVPVLNAKGESLKAGALATNSIYTVRYNSATGNFILQGDGGDVEKIKYGWERDKGSLVWNFDLILLANNSPAGGFTDATRTNQISVSLLASSIGILPQASGDTKYVATGGSNISSFGLFLKNKDILCFMHVGITAIAPVILKYSESYTKVYSLSSISTSGTGFIVDSLIELDNEFIMCINSNPGALYWYDKNTMKLIRQINITLPTTTPRRWQRYGDFIYCRNANSVHKVNVNTGAISATTTVVLPSGILETNTFRETFCIYDNMIYVVCTRPIEGSSRRQLAFSRYTMTGEYIDTIDIILPVEDVIVTNPQAGLVKHYGDFLIISYSSNAYASMGIVIDLRTNKVIKYIGSRNLSGAIFSSTSFLATENIITFNKNFAATNLASVYMQVRLEDE